VYSVARNWLPHRSPPFDQIILIRYIELEGTEVASSYPLIMNLYKVREIKQAAMGKRLGFPWTSLILEDSVVSLKKKAYYSEASH